MIPVGKTVWSGDYSTYQWSGKRLLDEINEENGPNSGITINSAHRSLFTTRPIWCSFFGVTCGDVSGTPAYASVVELFLDSLSLNGTLTDSIGNFRSITTFSMGSNYVYGSIPSAINNWSGSISRILLFQNLFQGTIPEVFSKFSKLTDIQLNENYFIGTIPSFIGSLSSLTVLQLFSNNFVGSIPSTIGNINKLERLRLEGNSLVGSIPNSITKLSLLDLLYLSSNSLTGTIPSNINALTRLRVLQAGRNQLTGTIPYMADLSELFILDLFSNKLTMGSFSEVDPAIFSEMTLQGPMNLSSNCLTLVTKDFFAPASCQQRGVPTSQPTISKW